MENEISFKIPEDSKIYTGTKVRPFNNYTVVEYFAIDRDGITKNKTTLLVDNENLVKHEN